MEQYFIDSEIPMSADPLDYWRVNKKWPKLQEIARRFLSSPPGSVESERVFSTLGGIYKPKRSRLSEENAKIQLFLHHHL